MAAARSGAAPDVGDDERDAPLLGGCAAASIARTSIAPPTALHRSWHAARIATRGDRTATGHTVVVETMEFADDG
ncbi:MAG: hypothetical protein ACK6DP_12995 [Gemmatimonas sp.]|jgi:hypothetical protein|uniref:hypothetical protein n=1 Tax=Gemmatimonas sp. TaxID=1962908 RepID=UPI00391FA1B3|nr:hypothetical protein [Gemmatimonadota bacterium]